MGWVGDATLEDLLSTSRGMTSAKSEADRELKRRALAAPVRYADALERVAESMEKFIQMIEYIEVM